MLHYDTDDVSIMPIAFIAPDAAMYNEAVEITKPFGDIFSTAHALLNRGVAAAQEYNRRGIDIFVSRGGTADGIRMALPSCTVVPILISSFDLVRACAEAKKYGKNIGMVAFPSMIQGIDGINPLVDVIIQMYPMSREEDAGGLIEQAVKEGAEVIVGGTSAVRAAANRNVPAVFIESGKEAVTKSVFEAVRISRVMARERASSALYRALITHVDNAVVAVNEQGRVMVINPAAERMIRVQEAEALHFGIGEVWPELRLHETVTSGKNDLGSIIQTCGRAIICNKVPITVGSRTVGAVATCHDVRTLDTMKVQVSARADEPGHRARITFNDIVGQSVPVRKVLRQAASYAVTDSTVLLLGETGTGKELFAQSIHNGGKRASGPFVAVNCAALPENLLESELFGYTKGAFTDANPKGKAGLLELAHGGTVFLDEIAELSLGTQGKILRVLQEKQVMRLGGDKLLPVDVRIIAATNRKLLSMMERGSFRDDLYYRINVLRLEIPPLRARKEDIPLLIQHLLRQCVAQGRPLPVFSSRAIAALQRHTWPGNIRELKNLMERIAATVLGETVSERILRELLDTIPCAVEEANSRNNEDSPEREKLRGVLAHAGGNMKEAAKMLGISRVTLWRRRKQLGV